MREQIYKTLMVRYQHQMEDALLKNRYVNDVSTAGYRGTHRYNR